MKKKGGKGRGGEVCRGREGQERRGSVGMGWRMEDV